MAFDRKPYRPYFVCLVLFGVLSAAFSLMRLQGEDSPVAPYTVWVGLFAMLSLILGAILAVRARLAQRKA